MLIASPFGGSPTHCVFHMLPLQPRDNPELPAEQEKRMLQDLQDDLTDYLSDEMLDKLLDMAATIIEREGIDSHSDEGSDLAMDMVQRICVTIAN